MKHVYNLATNGMTQDELAETDSAFIDKGWVITGFNRLTPENFRVYYWGSDSEPDFPEGFGSEPRQARIALNGSYRPYAD